MVSEVHLLKRDSPPLASPHRRLNQLTGEWVLVSPQRVLRPWKGQVETVPTVSAPDYDPTCQLCPGNLRDSDVRNPRYPGTFVFDNDFPALLPATDERTAPVQGPSIHGRIGNAIPAHAPEIGGRGPDLRSDLLGWRQEHGLCRVMCFSPIHRASLSSMPLDQITAVVDTWSDQHAELAALPFVSHVQIFENRGAMMGASNPHPHSQIWATSSIPDLPAREYKRLGAYRAAVGSCLLCDYASLETRLEERVVHRNQSFLTVVPFWSVWPFETLIISIRHAESLPELSSRERRDLAEALSIVTGSYDRLLDVPFPYSMGFHQGHANGGNDRGHLHVHFYPPLLRSATVRKFMVGYELLCGPQRDLTPEQAAERLRAQHRAQPLPARSN